MEFDSCATTNADRSGGWSYSCVRPTTTLFEQIEQKYKAAGYKLPRLIFWNINSRTSTIPVKENDLGVALVSGYSPSIAKMVFSNELDPFKLLLDQINTERYQVVEDAIKKLV
jgi:hypothetical protein